LGLSERVALHAHLLALLSHQLHLHARRVRVGSPRGGGAGLLLQPQRLRSERPSFVARRPQLVLRLLGTGHCGGCCGYRGPQFGIAPRSIRAESLCFAGGALRLGTQLSQRNSQLAGRRLGLAVARGLGRRALGLAAQFGHCGPQVVRGSMGLAVPRLSGLGAPGCFGQLVAQVRLLIGQATAFSSYSLHLRCKHLKLFLLRVEISQQPLQSVVLGRKAGSIGPDTLHFRFKHLELLLLSLKIRKESLKPVVFFSQAGSIGSCALHFRSQHLRLFLLRAQSGKQALNFFILIGQLQTTSSVSTQQQPNEKLASNKQTKITNLSLIEQYFINNLGQVCFCGQQLLLQRLHQRT
jgi:hypothetical protein